MRSLFVMLACLIVSGYCQQLCAQKLPQGLQIGLDFYQGTTLRHRPTMVFPLPNPARMISIEVAQQTNGSQAWHRWYGYPRVGWTISVLDYGNREVLGRAYSLHPFLDIYILRSRRWTLLWRTSFGLALIDRRFDRVNNLENNAIGSPINNHASLNLLTEIKVSPILWIRAGGTLSHNSNGRLQVPNLGLNTAKIRIGATYQLNSSERLLEEVAKKEKPNIRFIDRLQLHLRWGQAFKEDKVAGGPTYSVMIPSAHIGYQFGRKNRLQLGWEYIYDRGVKAFLDNHQVEEENAGLRYRRHALLLGHEFLLARVGLMTQAFIYMNPPFEAGNTNPWGVKIGPNYYFLPKDRNYNAFVGIYLKAHKAIAAYAELTVGVNFGGKAANSQSK